MMLWDEMLSNDGYITKIMAHPKSIGAQLHFFERPSGCVTPTHRGNERVWLTVLAVAADAPAAGWVVGRNKSFSKAKYMCRGCNAGQEHRCTHACFLLKFLVDNKYMDVADLDNLQKRQLNCPLELLTAEEDERQRGELAMALRKSNTKATLDRFGRLYGVRKCRHFMYWSRNTDIAKCAIQDGMHVMLEGVIKYLLYLTFWWFVHTLKLPLATLNYMIAKHPYTMEESHDKPGEIMETHLEGKATTGGKVKLTAGQVLVLSRNFIPIFAAYVWNAGVAMDSKWRCMEMALLVLFAMLDTEFTVASLLQLEQQIGTFYDLFAEAWGADMALPKMHYVMHIPLEIFLYGPMRFMWCMRFEAKHQWYVQGMCSFHDPSMCTCVMHAIAGSSDCANGRHLGTSLSPWRLNTNFGWLTNFARPLRMHLVLC
jgi:hypothetical protein